MRAKKIFVILPCFVVFLLATKTSNANAEQSALVQEIVVTATRRSVSQLKAPISITALSGDQLDRSNIESTLDLQNKTTGFVIKTNAAIGQPYIRGVGSDLISAGADSSVAVFVDDVYHARPAAAIHDFFDVDRVEVVKGPQGTLFGRNATGGALRIFSNRPTNEWGANADLLLGNYYKVRITGAVNFPIREDAALIRVSGLFNRRDGYTENLFNGTDLDDENAYGLRAQLLLRPASNLEVLLSADLLEEDSSRAAAAYPDPNTGINGGLQLGGTAPADRRTVFHNEQGRTYVKSWGTSADATLEGNGFTIRSITSFRKSEFDLRLDLDATEVDFASNSPTEQSDVFTQEIQINSETGSSLSWILGGFYLHEDATQVFDINLPLFLVRNQPQGDVSTNAYAVFGELSYRVADKWAVTFGGRYSYEKRDLEFRQTISDPLGALGPTGTVILTDQQERDWSAFTPRFVIEFEPNENLLTYASISRGFKAGGFNTNAFQQPFDPEFIWSYEIGGKATLADNKVTINSALFHYDYSDLQVLTLPPGAATGAFPTVENAAAATLQGTELNIALNPNDQLNLDFSGTFLDATFDEFVSVDPNNPALNPDRSGKRLQQAPKWSLSAAAEHSWAIKNDTLFSVRGEWRYQSPVFFNTFQDPATEQPGFSLFNASAVIEDQNRGLFVRLFVKNIASKEYSQTIVRQDPLVGTLLFLGPPRVFGVQLGAGL